MSNEKESMPIGLILFFLLGAAAIFCGIMSERESSSSSSSYYNTTSVANNTKTYNYSSITISPDDMNWGELKVNVKIVISDSGVDIIYGELSNKMKNEHWKVQDRYLKMINKVNDYRYVVESQDGTLLYLNINDNQATLVDCNSRFPASVFKR
jgi:hypothetical protein